MALNIYVYILLIFFIVQILCLRDETLIIKYWIEILGAYDSMTCHYKKYNSTIQGFC